MEDYYNILGVSRTASDKEIKQAYRKLARQHHPDVNRGDKDAEERFKRINEAHEVLSDSEDRRKYDEYGENWKHADELERARGSRGAGSSRWYPEGGTPGFSFDFGDISSSDLLEDIFSGMGGLGRSSAVYQVDLGLEEAFNGAVRHVEVPADNRRKPSRRLEVKIPPGVDTGSKVRVAAGSGRQQDLFLQITVRSHPRFRRAGPDLYTETDVPLADMALGGEAAVTTLNGKVMLTIPPETPNGQTLRLAGQGMPRLGRADSRGDLYVTTKVLLPRALSEKERLLFQELRERSSAGRE